MGRRTIGPASSRLGEGLAALATPVVGRTHARWHGRQVYLVSSGTLAWLASGLSGHCVKKQCVLAGLCFEGRTALDLRLSLVCTGVAAMGQDCNYQLDTMKLGRKKG